MQLQNIIIILYQQANYLQPQRQVYWNTSCACDSTQRTKLKLQLATALLGALLLNRGQEGELCTMEAQQQLAGSLTHLQPVSTSHQHPAITLTCGCNSIDCRVTQLTVITPQNKSQNIAIKLASSAKRVTLVQSRVASPSAEESKGMPGWPHYIAYTHFWVWFNLLTTSHCIHKNYPFTHALTAAATFLQRVTSYIACWL